MKKGALANNLVFMGNNGEQLELLERIVDKLARDINLQVYGLAYASIYKNGAYCVKIEGNIKFSPPEDVKRLVTAQDRTYIHIKLHNSLTGIVGEYWYIYDPKSIN